MNKELERVLDYHQATKHDYGRFARGPGHLDWETQPDPFRRYRGATVLELERVAAGDYPPYDAAFVAGNIRPAELNLHSLSQLFFDSLALSAWKRAGDTTWALRVNPSSGNLHPTEGYLISGAIDGLSETPFVAHYVPRSHALEVRAEVPEKLWRALSKGLPQGAVLMGLTSIHWREAWKYGERAFRYCQLDVGHALAAISLAAAGLGWQATLLDELGTEQLAKLLGVSEPQGAEAEEPDCLVAVYPQGPACPQIRLPGSVSRAFTKLSWQGKPNVLSPSHVAWARIDQVAEATSKPPTDSIHGPAKGETKRLQSPEVQASSQPLRRIIHQRRSAAAMDGQGSISRDAFYKLLKKTLARPGQYPFAMLPWRPLVHLALFVHRVHNLEPGLYVLLRDPAEKGPLQAAMREDLSWQRPGSCPSELELYLSAAGNVQTVARQLSCGQDIASDGCFSLGMLASFEVPLRRFGPWFYRRLFWECGMIGQVLYLEAEAAGVRGTGIGCFFDDPVHQFLGLGSLQYHSLYHFTIGSPIRDVRLETLPAYPSS